MKTLGERDYDAHETMHHLLSLKLHSSSFNVIPVSLNGSCRVHTSPSVDSGDTSCTNNSLLDVYANREQYYSSPEIMNLTFFQFATRYKLVNAKLTKLPEMSFLASFELTRLILKGPNFALYCKYQLSRYKPWQYNQNDARANQEPSDDAFITHWQELV